MTATTMNPRGATSRPLLTLSAGLLLAACTLPTMLADTSAGDDTGGAPASSGEPATTGGEPTTGGGGESGEAPFCKDVQVVGTPLSPNVVLVLDKSGSMVTPWDHDDDPQSAELTRWASLHQVVEGLVTDFDGAINFGAHLVPHPAATSSYSDQGCLINPEIDIAVAASNQAAILAGIPAANEELLRGGTSTASGAATAVDHLKSLDPAVPRAVVLVTDGAANCSVGAAPPELFEAYDERVHTIVDDAFALDGIPTYVVGVDIEDLVSPTEKEGNPDATNTFERLNELALQGGRARNDPDQRFYNTTNQSELAAALAAIALDAMTCIVPLDASPIAPKGTGVEIDGAPIPFVTDCASESGWMYTHPEGPFDAIVLCGAACGGLKAVGQAEITVCQLP